MKIDNDLNIYMREATKYPLLTREEEVELGRLALHGNKKEKKEAQDKLVVSNLRFVVQIASKYRGYTKSGKVSLSDLVQEGNAGLIKASARFDPEKGYRFVTYAMWWVKAYIQKHLMEQHSLVKIGTTQVQRQLFFKMGAIRAMMETEDPDLKEEMRIQLAEEYKVEVNDILEMEKRVQSGDLSLDASVMTDDESITFKDNLNDQYKALNDIEKDNTIDFLRERIEESMLGLTQREKDIIKTRWLSDEKVTLAALGKRYNLSRERIRQIEVKAINKMMPKLRNIKETLKEI